MTDWSVDSWQALKAAHQVAYRSTSELEDAVNELSRLPPLVTSWEVETLKHQLAEAASGKRFLLQGGDCAESLDDCTADIVANKLKVLLQMSLVMVHGSRKPVIRVGRIAGQYAKPRSEEYETRDGVSLLTYRGDLINFSGFSEADREPNPRLLLRAYERSALTLNFIRALVRGGFADLHHPENWDMSFAQHSALEDEYHRIAQGVTDSLKFMENVLGVHAGDMEWVDFFTSHEALHLSYEQAQTRRVPRRPGYYNLSCHFPWIGMRTAHPDGAHVEYCRGIRNPIGIKIGPSMKPDQIQRLLDILHPDDEPGRIALIHRMGNQKIGDALPAVIRAVRATGKRVLWCCDPMHGNTRLTSSGTKTRHFDDILGEVEQAFEIHRTEGGFLGGVHIELTGEDVTECLGGARNLKDADLERAYRSEVDPRLNYEQALEIALRVSRFMN